MKILMFIEQLEHIAGMESIAIQMGNWLSSSGHEVMYGITYGEVPANLSNLSIIRLSEKNLPYIIQEHKIDTVINHCDWNYTFLESILSFTTSLQVADTKFYTICHSDFWSLLAIPTTPKHDLLPLYSKLRTHMSIIAIADRDYKCFSDMGFNTFLWKFGTTDKQRKITKKATYNRIAFVSARWSVPKKNYKYATILFDKLQNMAKCEVVAYGRDWKGSDNYGVNEDEIYQLGTLVIMPSFRETRPLTSISAYKHNCPIFELNKWIGLPNEVLLSGNLNKDLDLILSYINKPIKRYKPRKDLDLDYTLSDLCRFLETDEFNPLNLSVNVGSDAYLACQSRKEWQTRSEDATNLLFDYRNNWIPQKKSVLLLADGVGASNEIKTKYTDYIVVYRNTMIANNGSLNKVIDNIKPTYVGIVQNNKFLVGNSIVNYDNSVGGYDVIRVNGVASFFLTDRFEFDNSGCEKPKWKLFGNPTEKIVDLGEFL